MKTNRMTVLSALIIIAVSLVFSGCAKNGESGQTTTSVTLPDEYEDGIYYAAEAEFAAAGGWKSVVTIEVKDSRIVSADWNGAHKNGGVDKKTASKNGTYAMVAIGGAASEWHEQAEKAEQYLIEKQDPTDISYKDDEGHTDAIAGVTIHVNDFFSLAAQALAQGPAGYGMYKDGAYHAEEEEFSEQGWKEVIDATVISGYIAAVNWDPVNSDGESKKTLSADGTYGMVAKGGASAEWHEQAELLEKDIIDKQDLNVYEASNDSGGVDTVAGVSITVIPAIELLKGVIEVR